MSELVGQECNAGLLKKTCTVHLLHIVYFYTFVLQR